MNKFQVLLPDWLEDYVEFLSEKYDLPISEIIRMQVSAAGLFMVAMLYPDFKTNLSLEIMKNIPAEYEQEPDVAALKRKLSKLYHESRKAVEFRMEKEKSTN
jgi:hypothetical protein